MSSFLKLFKGKEYVYNSPNALINFSPEEILNLVNPKDVNPDILKHGHGRLGKYQYEALQGIIELQKIKDTTQHKKIIDEKIEKMHRNRDYGEEERTRRIVQGYTDRDIPVSSAASFSKGQSKVDALIVDTTKEMIAEQVKDKDLQNRLRALKDEPQIPYTEEEKIYKATQKLGGKRKRKNVSKRRRREKTRKGRKHRKTHRRK